MHLGASAILAFVCTLAPIASAEYPGIKGDSTVEEISVRGTIPQYDYPPNPLDTPKGPTQIFRGHWHLDFEGAQFQEESSGRRFATMSTDGDLYALVPGGSSPYDWHGCFAVVLEAAIADYPAPHVYRADWLLIERVISAKKVDDSPTHRCP
jgi:hypothetical protein